ncbi:7TM diverse intracellular signaling domain-containing protein [Flammeovirga aprica]|nr:7TM diverse intracellular signaling domain-containing protein [Flammeovirga aprica]
MDQKHRGEFLIPIDRITHYSSQNPNEGIEDVKSKEFSKSSYYEKIKKGSEIHWVKINIKAEDSKSKKRVLELMASNIDSISVYFSYDNEQNYEWIGTYTKYTQFKERPRDHKNFTFDIKDNADVTVIIRYYKSYGRTLIYKIRSENVFNAYSNKEYCILGIFYGLFSMILLYNFLMVTYFKEKFYFYYSLFLLSFIITSLVRDRLGYQYIWYSFESLNIYLINWSPILLLVTFILFIKSYIKIEKRLKRIKLYFFLYVIVLCLWNNFVITPQHLVIWNSLLFYIPLIAIFLYLVYWSVFVNSLDRYFCIGLFFVMCSFYILGTESNSFSGVINESGIINHYSSYLCIVIMIISFSISLFKKFNTIKVQEQKVQEDLIIFLKEKEQTISQEVEVRTQEIEEQKQIIVKKNESLENAIQQVFHQAEEIRRINNLLTEKNKLLEADNVDIKEKMSSGSYMSFDDFKKLYPQDENCRQLVASLKWENKYQCPKCSGHFFTNSDKGRRCKKCNYIESEIVNTIFSRVRFPLQKAFYIMYYVFIHKGDVNIKQLSDEIDIRYNTCLSFVRKVKTNIDKHQNEINYYDDDWKKLIKTTIDFN